MAQSSRHKAAHLRRGNYTVLVVHYELREKRFFGDWLKLHEGIVLILAFRDKAGDGNAIFPLVGRRFPGNLQFYQEPSPIRFDDSTMETKLMRYRHVN